MLKMLFPCLALLALSMQANAQPMTPYDLGYQASFRGLKASAQRSLKVLEDDNYQLHTTIRLRLFGVTMSQILEDSVFRLDQDDLLPQHYNYVQTGAGSRSRSVDFDWDDGTAIAKVNDNVTKLQLDGPVVDELSAFAEVERQLAAGNTDIRYQAIDGNEISEDRFEVVAQEQVDTPLGKFNAVKLRKVRSPDSKRVTELWFASDWNYVLLKLYQRDPRGREMELNLSRATLGGEPVIPLSLD